MATTYTPLLEIPKHDPTDPFDITKINEGFDLIDAGMAKAYRGKFVINKLTNSDFRASHFIAQAGLNGLHGITKYVGDRWISWSADATFADGYITPGSPIDQRLDPAVIDMAATYTVAICLSDGTVRAASGNFTSGFGAYALGVYCPPQTTQPYVRLQTGLNIRWAALYEGAYTADTLPEYQYKGYAAELAECQLYYENSWYGGNTYRQSQTFGYVASTNLDTYICFKQSKRIAPTIKLFPYSPDTYTNWLYFDGGYKEASQMTTINRCGNIGFMVRLTPATGDTLTKGACYAMEGHWEACADR